MLVVGVRIKTELRSMTQPSGADRRRYSRVLGPFDGNRIGALKTPVRIFDLNEGGCFVNAVHEQALGTVITLEIDLPYEGRIKVKAEVLYNKPDFGFATRFIEMTDEASARLSRSLQQLRALAVQSS